MWAWEDRRLDILVSGQGTLFCWAEGQRGPGAGKDTTVPFVGKLCVKGLKKKTLDSRQAIPSSS